ncbi:hypothetical protein G6F65_021233 [Rhizopus arrhizus]|nr:hypothetical protein G6F65_021233 [Rhizopus arrhizus]
MLAGVVRLQLDAAHAHDALVVHPARGGTEVVGIQRIGPGIELRIAVDWHHERRHFRRMHDQQVLRLDVVADAVVEAGDAQLGQVAVNQQRVGAEVGAELQVARALATQERIGTYAIGIAHALQRNLLEEHFLHPWWPRERPPGWG